MRQKISAIATGLLAVFFLTGFLGPDGTPEEQRAAIQKMRSETLTRLHQLAPQSKGEIQKAAGYAVFSNTGINIFVVSSANGYGVAHNNKTGKDTYMKMYSGGVGVGMGIKDFRGIFIFRTQDAMNGFINEGWAAGGQADAAAKGGDTGAATAAALDVGPGIKLYQITENGLALQATIQGTKYLKNDELNE